MKTLADLLSAQQVVTSTSGPHVAWATRNPLDEARDLYKMVTWGSCTIDSIRDLIAVPPHIEAALHAYCRRYPEDGKRIQCVLRFRAKVAQEFERLIETQLAPIPEPEATSLPVV